MVLLDTVDTVHLGTWTLRIMCFRAPPFLVGFTGGRLDAEIQYVNPCMASPSSGQCICCRSAWRVYKGQLHKRDVHEGCTGMLLYTTQKYESFLNRTPNMYRQRPRYVVQRPSKDPERETLDPLRTQMSIG